MKEFLHHFITAAKQMVKTLINIKIDRWMGTCWIALYKAQLRQEWKTKSAQTWNQMLMISQILRRPFYFEAHSKRWSQPLYANACFSNAPTDANACVPLSAQSSHAKWHGVHFIDMPFLRRFSFAHMFDDFRRANIYK